MHRNIRFRRLLESGTLPSRGKAGDAGLDLSAAVDVTIQPGTVVVVPTGFAVEIPDGMVGLLFPRSSLHKRGLKLANSVGVVDAGYRGPLDMALENTSNEAVAVARGQRLCQLVVMKCINDGGIVEVTELSDSDRGEDGFGSTGL